MFSGMKKEGKYVNESGGLIQVIKT